MTGPLVSIGLPAFKARYFKEALLSLRRQSYVNFEVLVQDDASQEDLKAIFLETVGNDIRFRYERNEVNTSPNFVQNWNRTLARSKGEFFVLASDDDIYDSRFLEELLKLAGEYPKVDLFYSPIDYLGADGVVIKGNVPPRFESGVEYAYQLYVCDRHTVVPNYMVRTAALKAICGFVDLPAAWGSDWQTWCRLARNGVVCADRALFQWRSSGENVSSIDSPYWFEQKLKARMLERDLCKKMVDGLMPKTIDEQQKYAELRHWLIDDFNRHFIETQYMRSPFGRFVRYLVGSVARRENSFEAAYNLLYQWLRMKYYRWRALLGK